MKNKVLALAILATALLSIQAVSFTLTGVLDLGVLFDYADPELRIYELSNNLILKQNVNQEMTRVDFSNYTAGLYPIYLKDDQNLFVEKVLKL